MPGSSPKTSFGRFFEDFHLGDTIVHAREDYPNRDDKDWMKHTLAWIDDEKRTITLDDRPVHTYTMSNDIEYIKPKARVY